MQLNRRRGNGRKVKAGVAALVCVLFVIAFIVVQPVSERISRLTGETSRNPDDRIDMEQPVRLKVVYPDEQIFMEKYGKSFRLRYPNVSFEVLTAVPGDPGIPLAESGSIKKMLNQERPDVLLLNPESLGYLAAKNQLAALDSWIVRDRFDLQAFDSKVTDRLRQLGGGLLYGLAPEIERMGLFYNRDLFRSEGFAYPVSRMSWYDVLQTAARFQAEGGDGERIFGLSVYPRSTPGSLISLVAATLDLRMIDPVSRGLTLQAAGWRDVWTTVIGGYKNGYLAWETLPARNLFLEGKVAMSVQPFTFLSKLRESGGVSFDWDVVTEPVNPGSPDQSATFQIPMIYAVYAGSPSAKVAWELVKHINSPEIADQQLHDNREIPLLSRKQQLLERLRSSGVKADIDCFYELKPGGSVSAPKDGVPAAFRSVFAGMMDGEAVQVLEGRKTVAEALQAMERQGGEALLHSRTEGR
ncbi:ABC transporter substrate-binding protein [Paenibacillus sp. GCM10012303]|uniref:ABC transporter substrate-binding protein n=1 Tax=Paenibacillus sp. GCM10012303 TaxID=3317340 RepID=UPI0036D239F1